MRERDIERYLVKRVKELGGEVRKVKWLGRAHAPDRVVMLPTNGCVETTRGTEMPLGYPLHQPVIWVELKAPGEKPRPGQLREHERMRRMGQRVEVIDSLKGVDDLLA